MMRGRSAASKTDLDHCFDGDDTGYCHGKFGVGSQRDQHGVK